MTSGRCNESCMYGNGCDCTPAVSDELRRVSATHRHAEHSLERDASGRVSLRIVQDMADWPGGIGEMPA